MLTYTDKKTVDLADIYSSANAQKKSYNYHTEDSFLIGNKSIIKQIAKQKKANTRCS